MEEYMYYLGCTDARQSHLVYEQNVLRQTKEMVYSILLKQTFIGVVVNSTT